jgi:methyl coenzyme M reductase beta subunit
MVRPVAIRVIDDDNSGAEALAGGLAHGKGAQIDGRDGAPAVVEDAGYAFGRLRQVFQIQERHDLDHAVGRQRVSFFAQLEEQKQHG